MSKTDAFNLFNLISHGMSVSTCIHQLAPERSELPSTSGLPFASKRTRMPRLLGASMNEDPKTWFREKKHVSLFNRKHSNASDWKFWYVFKKHSKTSQNKWWKVKKKRLRDIWMQINIKLCSWLVFCSRFPEIFVDRDHRWLVEMSTISYSRFSKIE